MICMDILKRWVPGLCLDEVQRQFAMPYHVDDLVEQYRLYTYPYGVFGRIEELIEKLKNAIWMALFIMYRSFVSGKLRI